MFKKSLAMTLMGLFISPSMAPNANMLESQKSNGKGGKVSHKPSGAAQFKRAAKKRNNIRKFN